MTTSRTLQLVAFALSLLIVVAGLPAVLMVGFACRNSTEPPPDPPLGKRDYVWTYQVKLIKKVFDMTRQFVILLIFFTATTYSQQPSLQPWTQVYGTLAGQRLGQFVTGIKPSVNLSYRVAVYSGGKTSFYRLQTPTDTTAMLTLIGENVQLGDLNGDGFTDIVLRRSGSNPLYIDTVVIYWGIATGVDTLNPTKLHGETSQDVFGSSICIGNIVGDSIPDLVVGAHDYPGGAIIKGRVYIYKGGTPFDTIAAVVLNGDSARYTLGVACVIGDINDDGYNDLMVRGGFEYGADSTRYEYVDIWLGSVTFDTTRDYRIFGPYRGVRGLGCFDVNGDGVSDLLWATSDYWAGPNKTYVYYGGAGFNTTPSLILNNPGVADFANAIVNAGDMNGDGYNDIAVAASQATITSGFVFVFGGGPRIDSIYDAAVGMSSDADFGRSISSVGDINGDGLADIIIGAPTYEFGNNKGYWGIFKGDTAILVTDVEETVALPSVFTLFQSYPNPFNPSTTIQYELREAAFIDLEIYDLLGRSVTVLVHERKQAGVYESVFDARGVASGTYLYKLTVRTMNGNIFTDAKKITLIK